MPSGIYHSDACTMSGILGRMLRKSRTTPRSMGKNHPPLFAYCPQPWENCAPLRECDTPPGETSPRCPDICPSVADNIRNTRTYIRNPRTYLRDTRTCVRSTRIYLRDARAASATPGYISAQKIQGAPCKNDISVLMFHISVPKFLIFFYQIQ